MILENLMPLYTAMFDALQKMK